MTRGGLRLFLVAVVAVVIGLGSVGGFMWYVLSIPVGTSLIMYALLLSILILFPVSLSGYVFKADARVRAQRDQKRFAAFMEGHPSEKVLGCIRVRRVTGSLLMPSEAQELFVITPDKVFVVGVGEVIPRPGMEGTTVLKADEKVVPDSEIRKVELKAYLLGFRVRLSMVTMEREYKWWTWGLVPDRKGAKLEDYESVLRPAFGDKLSVKK